jgi:adhesin transport system outer membrane protein
MIGRAAIIRVSFPLPARFRRTACVVALAAIGCVPASAQELRDAVRQAVDTYPTLRANASEVRARDSEVLQARSNYFPLLSLDAGYAREKVDFSDSTIYESGYGVNFTARQLLFDAGATAARLRAAEASAAQGRAITAVDSNSVGLRAAEAYLTVLLSRELVRVGQQNLDTLRGLQGRVKEQTTFDVGLQSNTFLATSRVALALDQLTEFLTLLDVNKVTYREIVGSVPDPANFKYPDPGAGGALPPNLDAALQTALVEHPTLKAASDRIAESKARTDEARAARWPRLDLEAKALPQYNWNATPGTQNQYAIGVRLLWEMSTGGREFHRVDAAAAREQASADSLEGAKRDVREAVRSAYERWQGAIAALAPRQAHVENVAKTVSAYEEQFRAGRRSLLDLTIVQNELFLAQVRERQGYFDVLTNAYRLLHAEGVLLQRLGVTAPVPPPVK